MRRARPGAAPSGGRFTEERVATGSPFHSTEILASVPSSVSQGGARQGPARPEPAQQPAGANTQTAPQLGWLRFQPWIRLLLGVAALVSAVPGAERSLLLMGAAGCFVVYSVVAAVRRRAQAGVFGLLALFADTIFFLILANQGVGISIWLPSLFMCPPL